MSLLTNYMAEQGIAVVQNDHKPVLRAHVSEPVPIDCIFTRPGKEAFSCRIYVPVDYGKGHVLKPEDYWIHAVWRYAMTPEQWNKVHNPHRDLAAIPWYKLRDEYKQQVEAAVARFRGRMEMFADVPIIMHSAKLWLEGKKEDHGKSEV